MVVCSKCGERKETIFVTGEDMYCPQCYKLEECDILYGRGGDYDAFCDIKCVLIRNHDVYHIQEEDKEGFEF